MKTEKIINVAQTVLKETTNTSRAAKQVDLTIKPDTLELPNKPQRTPRKTFLKNLFKEKISNLTKKEISELEALPPEKYFEQAQNIAARSYGIPETLRAPIHFLPLDKNVRMCYAHDQNIIYIDPNKVGKNKNILYSFIKHEVNHQKQNLDAIRTEGLGEQVVETFAHKKTQQGLEQFVSAFKEMPEEEIEKLRPQLGEDGYNLVQAYKKALIDGEETEKTFLETQYQADYKLNYDQLENFRQLVIKEMGILPQDSREGQFAKDCYEAMMGSQSQWSSNKTALTTLHEVDSLFAQVVSTYEYFFKKIGL